VEDQRAIITTGVEQVEIMIVIEDPRSALYWTRGLAVEWILDRGQRYGQVGQR